MISSTNLSMMVFPSCNTRMRSLWPASRPNIYPRRPLAPKSTRLRADPACKWAARGRKDSLRWPPPLHHCWCDFARGRHTAFEGISQLRGRLGGFQHRFDTSVRDPLGVMPSLGQDRPGDRTQSPPPGRAISRNHHTKGVFNRGWGVTTPPPPPADP